VNLALPLLTLLIPAFRFGGGNDADLVEALSSQMGKPTILLASPGGGSWKKCNIPEGDKSDFQRLIKVYIGLEVPWEFDGGVAPVAWPWGLVNRAKEREYLAGFEKRPSELLEIRDNTISFKTKGDEAISMAQIQGLSFSKRLKVHRYFKDAFVRMSVKGVSEQSFLKVLASALGGRLEDGKDSYFLDVDEKVYRRRAIAAWQVEAARQLKARDPVLYADANYMVAMLQATTDGRVKKAFLEDNRRKSIGTRFPRGSKVYILAYERVHAYIRNSSSNSVANLFNDVVDPNQPVWGFIRVEGGAVSGFYNSENNHRIEF
jgi:hypothetical protein